MSDHVYDAIVIGSGISGGWAAKELCEKGLKTLVLERGRNVEHIKDYTTAMTPPWGFTHRDELSLKTREENPIVSRCYAFNEGTEHFFVKDKEHPTYKPNPSTGSGVIRWEENPCSGRDGRSAGVKWILKPIVNDGTAIDWPIRYKDIAPWYSYVESFAGISGNRDGLPQVPDGEFLPPMEMTILEKHFKKSIEENFPGRNMIISRTANLSRAINGRGPCQYRDLCYRGCPFGGYFSSNSATLPAAVATGNLTLRPFSVVHSIIYDENKTKGHRRSRDRRKHFGIDGIFCKDYFPQCRNAEFHADSVELHLIPFSPWHGQRWWRPRKIFNGSQLPGQDRGRI